MTAPTLKQVNDAINAFEKHAKTKAMRGHLGVLKNAARIGADINTPDAKERTQLMKAIETNSRSAVRNVLERGADVTLPSTADHDDETWAPLGFAVRHRPLMVSTLLPFFEHGSPALNASRTSFYEGEVSPLMDAARRCLESAGRATESPPAVKALLDRGADVNQLYAGETVLHHACNNGWKECIKVLLGHPNIDVNAGRADRKPIICVAFQNLSVARILLHHGGVCLQADQHSETGSTAMHFAVKSGVLETVQLLMVFGAEVATCSNKGETPMDIARNSGHNHIADLLNITFGWSPLRIGAGCRMHADIAAALKAGEMDPDEQCTTGQLQAAIITANATPETLGWADALAVCQQTTKLVVAATKGWGPTRHWLHHTGVRAAVYSVLVMSERMHRSSTVGAGKSSSRSRSTRALTTALPLLPPEMWLHIMSYFQRSWWAPTTD